MATTFSYRHSMHDEKISKVWLIVTLVIHGSAVNTTQAASKHTTPT